MALRLCKALHKELFSYSGYQLGFQSYRGVPAVRPIIPHHAVVYQRGVSVAHPIIPHHAVVYQGGVNVAHTIAEAKQDIMGVCWDQTSITRVTATKSRGCISEAFLDFCCAISSVSRVSQHAAG